MSSPLTAMLESIGVLSTARVGRRRAQEDPLTAREAQRIAKRAVKTLGEALAPSTWRGLEGPHRRLLQFRHEWEQTTGVLLPWDLCIIYWVQRLMSEADSPLRPSSALQYVSRAVAAMSRMGVVVDSQLLQDFKRGLKRLGALRPQHQAKPATSAQVAAVVGREDVDRDTKLAIVLGWCGAARVSDVVRLKCGDIAFQSEFVAVNWAETKSDPFRLGVTTGLFLSECWTEVLREAISGRAAGALVVDTTYRRIVAALKKEDPELSGHSLRRGALAELLQEGLCLESLRQLSRHSSLDALARYLPAGKLKLARQTASTSMVLDRGLSRGSLFALPSLGSS